MESQTSISFIIISIVLSTIVLCTIVGNVFVIIAILIDKNLQTNANQLVLSLAVSDLMVACLVMPLGAYNDIHQGWYLGKGICEFWTSADVLCCTASILNLLAIAIDRYWAVTNVDYIYKRTRRRVNLMILCAWTVGAIVSLAPIFGWKDPDFSERVLVEHKCLVSQDVAYQIFATISTFYAPLVLLLALYWRIFQIARKRIRRRPGQRVGATAGACGPKSPNVAALTCDQSNGQLKLPKLAIVSTSRSSSLASSSIGKTRDKQQHDNQVDNGQSASRCRERFNSNRLPRIVQWNRNRNTNRGEGCRFPRASEPQPLARLAAGETWRPERAASRQNLDQRRRRQQNPATSLTGALSRWLRALVSGRLARVSGIENKHRNSAEVRDELGGIMSAPLAEAAALAAAADDNRSFEGLPGPNTTATATATATSTASPTSSPKAQTTAPSEQQTNPSGNKSARAKLAAAAAASAARDSLMAASPIVGTAPPASNLERQLNHRSSGSTSKRGAAFADDYHRNDVDADGSRIDAFAEAPASENPRCLRCHRLVRSEVRMNKIGQNDDNAYEHEQVNSVAMRTTTTTRRRRMENNEHLGGASLATSSNSSHLVPLDCAPQEVATKLGSCDRQVGAAGGKTSSQVELCNRGDSGADAKDKNCCLRADGYVDETSVTCEVCKVSQPEGGKAGGERQSTSTRVFVALAPRQLGPDLDQRRESADSTAPSGYSDGEAANLSSAASSLDWCCCCCCRQCSCQAINSQFESRPTGRPKQKHTSSVSDLSAESEATISAIKAAAKCRDCQEAALDFETKLAPPNTAARLASELGGDFAPATSISGAQSGKFEVRINHNIDIVGQTDAALNKTTDADELGGGKSALALARRQRGIERQGKVAAEARDDQHASERRQTQAGSCHYNIGTYLALAGGASGLKSPPPPPPALGETGGPPEADKRLRGDHWNSPLQLDAGDLATGSKTAPTPAAPHRGEAAAASIFNSSGSSRSSLTQSSASSLSSAAKIAADEGEASDDSIEEEPSLSSAFPAPQRRESAAAKTEGRIRDLEIAPIQKQVVEIPVQMIGSASAASASAAAAAAKPTTRPTLDLRRKFRALGQLVSFVQTSRHFNSSSSMPSDEDLALDCEESINRTNDRATTPTSVSNNKLASQLNSAGSDKINMSINKTTATSATAASMMLPPRRLPTSKVANRPQTIPNLETIMAQLKSNNNINQNNEHHQQSAAAAATAASTSESRFPFGATSCRLQSDNDSDLAPTNRGIRLMGKNSLASNQNQPAALSPSSPLPLTRANADCQASSRQQHRQSSSASSTLHNNLSREPQSLAQSTRRRRENLDIKREKKAAKTLAIITGVFVCCWLPFFVNAILMAICGQSCTPSDLILSILLWLGYLNSLLNPIIYTIFSPDFRRAFRRLLCWQMADNLKL